jgi:hypothetical protein
MKILVSITPGKYKSYPMNEMLVEVDTETGKYKNVELNIKDQNDISRFMGMCYSGNTLIVSAITMVTKPHHVSKLIMIDSNTGQMGFDTCSCSHAIHDIASVYPGQLFCNSTDDDSMNYMVINLSKMKIEKEKIHLKLGKTLFDNLHFNSLNYFEYRWYASMFGAGWRNNDFSNGAVFEMPNRIIYSNIYGPHSVFFSSEKRICFCESLKGRFHFNGKYADFGAYTRGAVEDIKRGGFWVGLSYSEGNRLKDLRIPNIDTSITGATIQFVDYNGNIGEKISLEKFGRECYGLIKAQGKFFKQYI